MWDGIEIEISLSVVDILCVNEFGLRLTASNPRFRGKVIVKCSCISNIGVID
jgi:hypothetical protein